MLKRGAATLSLVALLTWLMLPAGPAVAAGTCQAQSYSWSGGSSPFSSGIFGSRAKIEFNNPNICGGGGTSTGFSTVWSMVAAFSVDDPNDIHDDWMGYAQSGYYQAGQLLALVSLGIGIAIAGGVPVTHTAAADAVSAPVAVSTSGSDVHQQGDGPKSGLCTATVTSLKKYQTVFAPTPEAEALVSPAQAAILASDAFGFTAGRSADEIALGHLTVPTYGRETSDNPATVSHVEPVIKDRLVYMVVFDRVEQPVSGPVVVDKDGSIVPRERQTFTAGLWVAVDAASGEVLGGESVG